MWFNTFLKVNIVTEIYFRKVFPTLAVKIPRTAVFPFKIYPLPCTPYLRICNTYHHESYHQKNTTVFLYRKKESRKARL